MTNPLSHLTTRGRCLLTAGGATAACAVLLDERGLLRIAAFAMLLPLLILLSVGVGKKLRVSARRTLHPERVTAGHEGEVELVLSRTGKLPTGQLLLEDGSARVDGAPSRFVVGRVSEHHSVSLRYPIRPARRGLYRIGPLHATITDPFWLTEFNRVLSQHSTLLVVPRTYPLHDMPRAADGDGPESGGSRTRTGQGRPDVIVRQYRQGDDLRKVHWPSSARKDEIMVRVDERPANGATTVLLDLRNTGHRGTAAPSLEWAISFVASVAVHINGAGHAVRVVTERGDSLADLPDNARWADTESLLDTLATVRSAQQQTISLPNQLGADGRLIAVLGAIDHDTARQLVQQRTRRQQTLAVILDNTGTSDTNHVTELLRAAGWGTVVTTPQHAIAQVWSQLCVTTRRSHKSAGYPR